MAKRIETLAERVLAFMDKHEMSATVLGQKALGDTQAVLGLLENRRRLYDETKDKLELFMASYRRDAA